MSPLCTHLKGFFQHLIRREFVNSNNLRAEAHTNREWYRQERRRCAVLDDNFIIKPTTFDLTKVYYRCDSRTRWLGRCNVLGFNPDGVGQFVAVVAKS